MQFESVSLLRHLGKQGRWPKYSGSCHAQETRGEFMVPGFGCGCCGHLGCVPAGGRDLSLPVTLNKHINQQQQNLKPLTALLLFIWVITQQQISAKKPVLSEAVRDKLWQGYLGQWRYDRQNSEWLPPCRTPPLPQGHTSVKSPCRTASVTGIRSLDMEVTAEVLPALPGAGIPLSHAGRAAAATVGVTRAPRSDWKGMESLSTI